MTEISRQRLCDAWDEAMASLSPHAEILGVRVGLDDLGDLLTSTKHLPSLVFERGPAALKLSGSDGFMASLEIKF
jgi:hypothetical protein